MRESLQYFINVEDQPPILKALAEVRRMVVHEGWCYHYVQAICLRSILKPRGNREGCSGDVP
jgi:hypothetical protein